MDGCLDRQEMTCEASAPVPWSWGFLGTWCDTATMTVGDGKIMKRVEPPTVGVVCN